MHLVQALLTPSNWKMSAIGVSGGSLCLCEVISCAQRSPQRTYTTSICFHGYWKSSKMGFWLEGNLIEEMVENGWISSR